MRAEHRLSLCKGNREWHTTSGPLGGVEIEGMYVRVVLQAYSHVQACSSRLPKDLPSPSSTIWKTEPSHTIDHGGTFRPEQPCTQSNLSTSLTWTKTNEDPERQRTGRTALPVLFCCCALCLGDRSLAVPSPTPSSSHRKAASEKADDGNSHYQDRCHPCS